MNRVVPVLVAAALGLGCARSEPGDSNADATHPAGETAHVAAVTAPTTPSATDPALSEAAGPPLPGAPSRSPLPVPDAAAPTAQSPIRPDAGVTLDGGRRCREQPPQDFLLRRHQIAQPRANAAERRRIADARARSIEYRTRHYGYFKGFGSRRHNPHAPRHYARLTRFMGLPVVVHEKIVPALSCVEQALLRDCAQHAYRPRSISGIRDHNSYQDYEVSNHVYGIAVDIDSHLNPCCGCVGHWPEHHACRRKGVSVFERMAMPECWVSVFERYGFYWLGHDELMDTMHFEFLGDPDRIIE